MTVIMIDGPEKAGKSTLVEALHLRGAYVRKWTGPAVPDDSEYFIPLQIDAKSQRIVVWDRGWASEVVYGQLLEQPRRLAGDWQRAELLYGRLIEVAVMLLGPNVETLKRLRDSTDLPIDPSAERRAFAHYGQLAGWIVLENEHTPTYIAALADSLMFMATSKVTA